MLSASWKPCAVGHFGPFAELEMSGQAAVQFTVPTPLGQLWSWMKIMSTEA